VPAAAVLERATEEFSVAFDRRRGGFGSAPKFPRPSELLFLLREHARTGASEPRDMVLVTLRAMALGGMRDHLGGGFHRYSVDADWRVPHFEKMLYDQAQLVLAYVEAAQLTGDRFYADVAIDTLDYVRADLTDEGGGFYSAEDADSVPPEQAGDPGPHPSTTLGAGPSTTLRARKMEGAFYIWREDEIRDVLGLDADVFIARYGVRPDGNAPFDPQAEFTHKNLLYTAHSLEEVASSTGRSVEEVESSLRRSREVLRSRRSTRPRPHLDDKVLTAWNGLMIAAFARAARTLDEGARFLADARRAAAFVRSNLWNPGTGQLLRRYRKGEAGVDGYAEDYAYLIFALLELFQADGDPQWLEWALALQERQDALFWDPVDGGWFSTTGRDPSVLLRLKEDYDGAEPAASSVSVLNLLTLLHLVPDDETRQKAERTLSRFGPRLGAAARVVPMMMVALSAWHHGFGQVVIVGEAGHDQTRALHRELASHYLPFSLVISVAPGESQQALARRLDFIGSMSLKDGAAAYVCRDFTCQQPVSSPGDLKTLLAADA
jgi:hypothetical protein